MHRPAAGPTVPPLSTFARRFLLRSLPGLARAGLLSAILLAPGPAARAQLTLITGNGTLGSLRTDSNTTVGLGFTVGAETITVTQLGAWDEGGNGLTASHPVGLFSSGGTLLGSVTVSAGTGDTLLNGYRYATLSSPVALSASTTYVIGAYFTSGGPDAWRQNTTDGVVTSDVATYYTAYANGTGLTFPNNQISTQVLAGANAIYVATIPEPATTALLAALATGALAVARSRRKMR